MDDAGHSGFTLIELLLTVALAGLLAGLAVPSMVQFVDKHRLRGAAETLAQELRQARSHALNYQKSAYFSVSASASQQWCYGWGTVEQCDCRAEPGTNDACESGPAGFARIHRQTSKSFPSVSLSLSRFVSKRHLRFGALRGTASADTLSLTNSAGELRVVISPLGRVRICSTALPGYPAC